MDATQVIDFDDEETDDQDSKKTVAFLKVPSVGEFPETLFPVYEGENIIGRHDSCDITIPVKQVSKKHACIEVHDQHHLICDYNSQNKTRRNQMCLKPRAFYELVDKVELMFADVKCQYLFAQNEDVTDKENLDSGSETASESMMPDNQPEEELNDKEKVPSSREHTKAEESVEGDFDQATQEYSYENPEQENFTPILCAETDSETDDEKEKKEDPVHDTIAMSVSTDQTLRYSPGGTGYNPEYDATVPYKTLPSTILHETLPSTIPDETLPSTIPDETLLSTIPLEIIPETPFIQNTEVPFTLKRAVDVKMDTARRASTGCTLEYGLSTLESLNSTRESMDTSESEPARKGLTGDVENKLNKVLFEDSEGEEIASKNDKIVTDSSSKEEEVLDDLHATQVYEPFDVPNSPRDPSSPRVLESPNAVDSPRVPESPVIPESLEETTDVSDSPEFLRHGNQPVNESTRISDGENPDNKTCESKTFGGKTSEDRPSEDNISVGETSAGKASESETSSGKTSESETSGDKTYEGKTSEGKISEDKVPEDDMEATQAYGLGETTKDDYEDMATQVYGSRFDSDHATLESGDELPLTQAYGLGTSVLEVPELSTMFKVPGAMNTKDLNELNGEFEGKEDAVRGEKFEEFDEMDIQPTQNYLENQESDDDKSSKIKDEAETSDSADNFPSLSSVMGCKSDSDGDFMSAIKPSRKKANSELDFRSPTTPVRRSSSIVIEGEHALSTEKRCYVECPTGEDVVSVQDKRASGAKKKSVRGRKRSAVQQGKVQQGTQEDTEELLSTLPKDDSTTSLVLREDTDEHQVISVNKRSKGRATRGRKSAAGTRSSRARGKQTEEADGNKNENAEVEDLPKGKKSARKRKITEDRAIETKVMNDEVETSSKKEKLAKSEDEKDVDMFKLEISLSVDSTDEFVPKKKPETKRFSQRDKNRDKRTSESNGGSETTNVSEKEPQAMKVKASTLRKGRGKKNQEIVDNIESNVTEVKKETVSDGSEGEPGQQRETVVKTSKKERGKRSQWSKPDLEPTHEIQNSMDRTGLAEMVCNGNRKGSSKVESDRKSLVKETSTSSAADRHETESLGKMEENITWDVNEAEIEEPKKTTRGRQKKRISDTKLCVEETSTPPPAEFHDTESLEKMEEDIPGGVNGAEVEGPKTTTRGKQRKRKSSESVQQKRQTAKKSRKNATTEERTEIKMEEDEIQRGPKTTDDDLLKVDPDEPKISPPPGSLAIQTSLSASSTSTSSSSISRSGRKGKQQASANTEGVEKKPSARQSVSGRKKSAPDTPSSPSSGKSRSGKKIKQEYEIEDPEDQCSEVKIIFTGLKEDAVAKATKTVEVLGGKVIEHLEDCTHVVTDKVRRTVKLLCAVSRGIPVVNMGWLTASKKSKSFVDANNFILSDKEAQKKFNFSMERSLELARIAALLDGYKVHVTPHVRPPPDEMKDIIKSARGEYIATMPTSLDNNVIVLSCEEDRALCEKVGIEQVYTAELLLTGILRQELDLEQHKLRVNLTPETPKTKGRRKR